MLQPATIWIEVPLPPRVLSPNNKKGRHWGKVCGAEAAYKAECLAEFLSIGPLVPPVTVHLVFYLGRGLSPIDQYKRSDRYFPKDEDNAKAAFKQGQDALVAAGIVPEDSWKYIRTGRIELLTRAKDHRNRACVMVGLESMVDLEPPLDAEYLDALSD